MSPDPDHRAPTFGFLGVGAIGRPIAEHLLAVHPMILCDADPGALEPFRGRADVVSSAADLGHRADVVFACLPSLEAHRRALLDPTEGLIAGTRRRGLVQVGTTGPDLARTLASALSVRGIAMVDAPVTGGVPRAKAATLTVIASGDEDLFAECEAAMRSFANEIFYLGARPGAAQLMKLINNLLSATNLAIGCEAMVLGAKAGLDPRQMLQVLNAGTGQNSATLTKIPDHVLPRTFDYGGRLEMICKDLKEVIGEAAAMAVDMPTAILIEQLYRRAATCGSSQDDMTTLIRHMEAAAGVEVGAPSRVTGPALRHPSPPLPHPED